MKTMLGTINRTQNTETRICGVIKDQMGNKIGALIQIKCYGKSIGIRTARFKLSESPAVTISKTLDKMIRELSTD